MSPLFVGQVTRTNRPFCEVLNSGWGGVISPFDCGNSIEVRDGTGPSVPRYRASWLVLSRIRPRYQVDTYVYSLLLVRTWKNQGAGS